MATSEYIPEKRQPSGAESLASLTRMRPRGRSNESLLALLPMVINDGAAILVALVAAFILRAFVVDKYFSWKLLVDSMGNGPLAVLYLGWFVLMYLLMARRCGLYGRLLKGTNATHELRLTAQASLTAGLMLCGLLYMVHNRDVSRSLVILLTLSAMVSLCVRRLLWRMRRYKQFEAGLSTRRVVILGTNHIGYALGRQIKSQSRLGYTLRGFIPAPGGELPAETWGLDVLGDVKDLRRIVRKHFIDEMIIADSCPVEQVIRLLKEARELGIDVSSISGYYNDLAVNAGVEYLGVFPLVSLHRGMQRTF